MLTFDDTTESQIRKLVAEVQYTQRQARCATVNGKHDVAIELEEQVIQGNSLIGMLVVDVIGQQVS